MGFDIFLYWYNTNLYYFYFNNISDSDTLYIMYEKK